MKTALTRLHRALESQEGADNQHFFAECAMHPHFLLDRSLVEMYKNFDEETFNAFTEIMVDNGGFHLPFKKVLLESQSPLGSHFVLAEEMDHGYFEGQYGFYSCRNHTARSIPRPPVIMNLAAGTGAHRDADGKELSHPDVIHAAKAICVLLTIVATTFRSINGATTEAPTLKPLNRSRAKSGKTPIPEFTTVKIGHYYDAKGDRHSGGTGRAVRMHLRMGHARRQHHGVGNALVKTVYIQPSIVNFSPAETAVLPKRRITV